jgi:hypothetical protein
MPLTYSAVKKMSTGGSALCKKLFYGVSGQTAHASTG